MHDNITLAKLNKQHEEAARILKERGYSTRRLGPSFNAQEDNSKTDAIVAILLIGCVLIWVMVL